MRRLRKRSLRGKHCAASAQRKIASHSSALVNVERLLYISGQDCGNKCLETRITTQRIKVRIDIEEGAIETVVIASRNTTGSLNTATGDQALSSNTAGHENTATGQGALASNTTGDGNTSTGHSALLNNTTGDGNTANGFMALLANTTGNFNTANGINALYFNTTGSSNIAIGFQAGANLTTGSDNIDIGNVGVAGEARTIRIGTQRTQTKTFIAGITGAGVMGVAVKINAAGQLGTAPSSQRFKTKIKPMDKASEAILALKPVTFRYKQEIDPEGIPQFGLVAEQVEKVNPDLVGRDADGKVYTVRYDAVNAMLLNEFLKEHRKVEKLEATVASLAATVKEQASQIQKVNARFEMNESAPHVAENNH
jgi:hypothetical protein